MAGFDINAIPPSNRSKEQVQAHLEIYKKTQDIVRVHNPTQEDFIVYNDRMVTNEQWLIPNKDRDMGKGKGNVDVPRYIALRYLNQMGTKLIGEKSKREWDKIKGQYRADERGQMEGRLAIRLNDKKEWEKITPKLWLGVVKKFQEGNISVMQEVEPKKQTFSRGEAALEELDIIDRELETGDVEQSKNEFINKIT